MANYQKILVTINLNPEHDNQILAKANDFRKSNKSEIFLAHAVEHINVYGSNSAFHAITDIETQIAEEHKIAIAEIAKQHAINEQQAYVVMGPIHKAISELRDEISADLIIVGAHEHHGLSLLLGSTADSLLHDMPCDILAVKLHK